MNLRLVRGTANAANGNLVLYRAFNESKTFTLGDLLDGESLNVSVKVDFNSGSNTNIGNFYVGLIGWTGSLNTPGAGDGSLIGMDVGDSSGRLVQYGAGNGVFLGSGGTTLLDWSSSLSVKKLYTLTYSIANIGGDYYLDYLVENTSVFGGAQLVDLSSHTNTVINGISIRLANGDVEAYISSVQVGVFSVPEPSTWMLLGSSLALLAVLRRRK